MYPQYAPQQQAPPPQQQQHRAPQHYAAPPGGFRQAPPQQRYPQQQQQQQPAMRSRRSAESDFFRGQYDSELRSLGAHPDKELISSLTQHAQEHLGSPPDRVRAHDVVDVIQRRIGGVRYDEYIYPPPPHHTPPRSLRNGALLAHASPLPTLCSRRPHRRPRPR